MAKQTTAALLGAIVAAGLGAGPAMAQESEDEIVVTAQRRDQSISEVPLAITAFRGDALERMGIDAPIELADQTPGLSTTNVSVGAPAFSIRGVGLEDFIGNNASGTAVYVDEVYPVSSTMQGFQLFDLERVEVLRGPQGTLYGRNALGGAINFVTRRPTEAFEAQASVSYDSLEEAHATAVVSGPLSANARGRIAVNATRGLGDGWQRNVSEGGDAADADRIAGRVQLALGSDRGAEFLISAFGERDRSVNPSWQSDDRAGLDGFLGVQFSSPGEADRVDVGSFFAGLDGQRAPRNDTEQYGASLHATGTLGGFDLTSITAVMGIDRDAYDNNDGSPATLADFHFRTSVQQYSQEFRLAGEGGRANWIAGLFYGYDEIDVNDVVLFTNAADVLVATDAFGLGTGPADTPSALGFETTETTDTTQETTAIGAYLHTEWSLAQNLSATVAGRYSFDRRRFSGNATDDSGFIIGAPGVITTLTDEQEESNVTWRVGIDYRLNDDVLLYASAATGYKSGVYYSGAVLVSDAWGYVEPESLLAFEVGAHAAFLDGRVTLDGAIFSYDYEDKQTLVFVSAPFFGPVQTLANIPEASVEGGEIELGVRTSFGLQLNVGLAYLDSQLDETVASVRGLPVFSPIAVGDELTQAPRFSANARARQTWAISGTLEAALELTYTYEDEKTFFLGDPLARSDDRSLFGARVSIAASNGAWELAVFGRNLGNSDAATFAYTNIAFNRTYALEEPALIGVELRAQR